MSTKDRWLQWELCLERDSSTITIYLNEFVQGKDEKWAKSKLVGFDHIVVRSWTTEQDVCRKLNKLQEKLLRKYVASYKKWDSIESKVLKNFTGGKISIENMKTNEFINKFV